MRVEQARVQYDLRLSVGPVADEMPAVFIAHGNGREPVELAGPIGMNPVPGTVITKARGIRDQSVTLEVIAEENRVAAVPGMAEVPDLIAADHDCVVFASQFRLVKREAGGPRQCRERVDEFSGLQPIVAQLVARRSLGELGLQSALG